MRDPACRSKIAAGSSSRMCESAIRPAFAAPGSGCTRAGASSRRTAVGSGSTRRTSKAPLSRSRSRSPAPRPKLLRVDGYLLLKFVHVLSAIFALGFNATYGFWLGRAGGDERILPFVLSTLTLVDRVANAFYGLLLVTGLAMVFVGALDLRIFWIGTGLVLYVLAVIV